MSTAADRAGISTGGAERVEVATTPLSRNDMGRLFFGASMRTVKIFDDESANEFSDIDDKSVSRALLNSGSTDRPDLATSIAASTEAAMSAASLPQMTGGLRTTTQS
jgi:hypothetical protein